MMKIFLESFLYISGGISIFFLFPLFGIFSDELSLINITKALLPIILTGLIYLVYLKETKEKPLKINHKEHELSEDEIVNIFRGMPYSKNNEVYSEGVFFWVKDGKLLTTFDFHLERGGDPDVFLEWVEQEKETPVYLNPTIQ